MATKQQDAEPEHRGPGRPPADIDPARLEALAKLHLTYDDIAPALGISKRTLVNKLKEPQYAEAYERGKAAGRQLLKRLQWKHAQMPSSAGVAMTIHMSKHHLGETEKAALEITGRIDSAIEVSVRDRLSSKLEALGKRISSRVDSLTIEAGADKAPVGAD